MRELKFSIVERLAHVTVVTLNRPEVMNALHTPAHDELTAIFDAFEVDPDQWVAIITGAGKAFSAGHDLNGEALGTDVQLPKGGFAGLTLRQKMTKPVIAAVNGIAMGGGFETALACDIIIASARASFALPEPRVGLVALAGGVYRLPRAIGEKRAMDIILTSRRVLAPEALSLGFVSRVVEPNALLDEAKAIALDICQASPRAIRASKEAVMLGMGRALSDAMQAQWTNPAMRTLFASTDITEGPKSFLDKRQPHWQVG